METLNRSLFLLLNADAQPGSGTLFMLTALAEWLIYGIPLLLAGLWPWGSRQTRVATVVAMLSVLLALAINQLIGLFWTHPRPFMIDLGHTFLPHQAETSFPSDHAVVFFALGLAFIANTLRRTGVVLVFLGGAVGWARIYLGVHFPLDIVGSLGVALVSNWVVALALSLGSFSVRLLDGLELVYRRIFALPIAKGWCDV